MTKTAFYLFLFCLIFSQLPAQILTTEMGKMRFFNTLDTARSDRITSLARHCYCLLELTDSTRSMRLNLDLDTDSIRADTPFYRLDYNTLSGTMILPSDSTGLFLDSAADPPGIYIKARDSVIRDIVIFRLLDYGVHHYSELRQNKQAGKIYDAAFVSRLMAQKPSLKFRRALAYCLK